MATAPLTNFEQIRNNINEENLSHSLATTQHSTTRSTTLLQHFLQLYDGAPHQTISTSHYDAMLLVAILPNQGATRGKQRTPFSMVKKVIVRMVTNGSLDFPMLLQCFQHPLMLQVYYRNLFVSSFFFNNINI